MIRINFIVNLDERLNNKSKYTTMLNGKIKQKQIRKK